MFDYVWYHPWEIPGEFRKLHPHEARCIGTHRPHTCTPLTLLATSVHCVYYEPYTSVHSSDTVFHLPSTTPQSTHRLQPFWCPVPEQTSCLLQGRMTFIIVFIYFYPLNMYKVVLLFFLGVYLILNMSLMKFLSLVPLSMMIFRKIYVPL